MEDKHKEDLNKEHLKEELNELAKETGNSTMRQLKITHSMCYNRDLKSLHKYLNELAGKEDTICEGCGKNFLLDTTESMMYEVNKKLVERMKYYVQNVNIELLCGNCVKKKGLNKEYTLFSTIPEFFTDTILYPVLSFKTDVQEERRVVVDKKTSHYALLLSFLKGDETFTEQKDRDQYKEEMQILEWMTGLDLKVDYIKVLFPPDGVQKMNKEDKGKNIETILSQVVDKVRMERIVKKEADE